ncbi:hypothetical protein A3726_25030 [Erythrobacter sp. HI0037]|nr:hypothetical protein A3726_25030 [Erythrobacter sp. HI0037]
MAIFAGAHGLANGLDAVLDAAAVLQRRGVSSIKIALIGNGMEKARLQSRAEREQLENIIFIDSVPKTQLVGLFARADVGLQVLKNVPAFYYGTSPNKFFDYISASLPVLNNYPGWLAEIIENEKCGIVTPPDDPEAFANGLVILAEDRKETSRMGTRAGQLAERDFSRELLARQWALCVEGVMADQKGAPGIP